MGGSQVEGPGLVPWAPMWTLGAPFMETTDGPGDDSEARQGSEGPAGHLETKACTLGQSGSMPST